MTTHTTSPKLRIRARIRRPAENPFPEVRPWTLIAWLFAAALPLFLITMLTSVVTDDRSIPALVAMVALHVVVVGWIHFQGVSLRRLAGSFVLDRESLTAAGFGLAVMVASVGTIGLGLALVSFAMPDRAASILQDQSIALRPVAAPGDVVSNLLFALCISVLAPIVEELLFRGALLHAWAIRWGLRKSILVSAALFAVLHPQDPLGAFLAAIVLSLIYLRTRSLAVPIAVHAFNNGVPCLLEWCFPNAGGTVAELQSAVWLFVAMILVAAPPLIWFFVRARDCWKAPLPYLDAHPIERERDIAQPSAAR